MTTTRFDGMSLRDAQQLYRELIMQAHPDREGGSNEEAAAINSDWQAFAARIINSAFQAAEAEKEGKTGAYSATVFADILRAIIHFDVDIEIIGFWIYAFRSFEYHEQLKALGFWFSGKHKAWIYSGGKKRPVRRAHTTDENRTKWGSTNIASEYEEEAKLPA